jgi:hypothetical protein
MMRSFRPTVDCLESRNLQSIALINGTLLIKADKRSNNISQVSINPEIGKVNVTLNAEFMSFDVSKVHYIQYVGGNGGHDTFVNNTSIDATMIGRHGANSFTGGTGFDTFNMFGDYNSLGDQGGGAVAHIHHGDDFIGPGIVVD